MVTKLALIYGHRGQDGTLLTQLLLKNGFTVVGVSRSTVEVIAGNGQVIEARRRPSATLPLLTEFCPDRVFYLAANHGSSESTVQAEDSVEQFEYFFTQNVCGLFSVASAIARWNPECFFFYASSGLVFEGSHSRIVTEESELSPMSYYAMAKAQGLWIGRKLRADWGMRFCSGILFNHESHLRSRRYFSARVIRGAYEIAHNKLDKLEVGNLDSRVDWGYAADFVDAFQLLADSGQQGDFLIATGKAHSSRDFLDLVFREFGLDWSNYVVEVPNQIRDRKPLPTADTSKIHAAVEWSPSFSFSSFVAQLVADHLRALSETGS